MGICDNGPGNARTLTVTCLDNRVHPSKIDPGRG